MDQIDMKNYLLDEIKKCKRKMNFAKFIDFGILYTAAGGILGICLELVSLFVPFYYVHRAAALCFGAGFLAGAGYAVYKRADMKQAARRLDSFGLKERMLTAYENLDNEDEFARLQRQDARVHYDRMRSRIRIPLSPERRHILALLVSIVTVIGMRFIPSPVREEAALRHQVQEQAKEEQEELEELLAVLESVDMEKLSEEQKAKLQELLDTMELSREELMGADSWESLSAAAGRLDYKYQLAAQSLEQLAGQIEYPDQAGIAGAQALAKAAANQSGQMASSGTTSGSSGEGNGERGGEDGPGGESGSGSGGQSGEGGSGNGSDGKNGQNGENDSGDGNGQNGNNSGNGNGQGDGNGSGNGNGQGGGNGSGGGSGSGRGTGSSDAVHDYVSIPNMSSTDPALTGNKNGDQDSDYYRQQNGLAWEGDHVDYSSVIGEYTDSAYEGIANGKYPSGMESVIRDYFENLSQ